MTGTAQIIRGNARHLPLADKTIDLIITSPPYFGLRSYTDGGQHYDGQIGDEPTPTEYVDALVDVTRECVRVLKPEGSLWVNLGDKYSNGGRTSYDVTDINGNRGGSRTPDDFRPKTLLGIPWRYALRCIDDLGLILRAEVIWSKPNGLPESVTDRVRRSHETWFHFTLQPRYFSAVDEIREPHSDVSWIGRAKQERVNADRNDGGGVCNTANPLGKLPGSVWTIPTEPLRVPAHLGVDHFAAFPMEWPRRIIRGWSPTGVCTACGEGRRPTTTTTTTTLTTGGNDRLTAVAGQPDGRVGFRKANEHTITGYACACPDTTAPTTPAVVLDPFGGTGTTALVAQELGRHGITVDMSRDYCRIAQWRTTDPKQRARAAGMPYTPVPEQVDGQDILFDITEAGA